MTILLGVSLILSSCMPQPAQVGVRNPSATDSVSDTDTDTTTTLPTPEGQLPETINFIQVGTTKETSQVNLFADYNDSFILRGNQINNYIREMLSTTPKSLCLVSKFTANNSSGSKEVLVMAARVRSYYNSNIGGREYFLQMEVANDTANTTDCLTVSLNNKISAVYGVTSLAYKIADVCPNCSSLNASQGFDLYDSTGNKISQISIDHLRLGILPELGSSGNSGTQACTSNSACIALDYNCCLQGQCVNHGEVKSTVDQNSSGYQSALEQVLNRPELIGNYTEYFYVCPLMIPTNPDNNPIDPDLDPVQQAADLFNELQRLYRCLNPVIDEFSLCTKKEELVSTKVSISGQYSFYARNDDITFSSLNGSLSYDNITSLTYAGIKIYEAKLFEDDIETVLDTNNAELLAKNDSLNSAQGVLLKMAPPANAINDTLEIEYRVDGTCERIGSQIARCKKFYKQGQVSDPPRSSDHPSGNIFKIPNYNNTTSPNFNIVVEVGGVKVSPGTDTWSLSGHSVVFSSEYPVYNNQQVTITYFVQNPDNIGLLESKEASQAKVNEHCTCGEGITCNLKPVYTDVNGSNSLTSYECVYPQPDTQEPPLQKTVFMSARTVAHKFYDANGVHYEFDNITNTSHQECAVNSGDETGCKLFQYESGNVTKPNNTTYTGFNEIFGSFSLNEKSPMPATMVQVKKGKQYDIFTDEGIFSSCLNCGTSYYSNLQKIFPDNFIYKGGGYLPDLVESRREYNQGKFNADDMKFGRACFVPPTMIPWTHKSNDNITDQRRNRLKAQHFLFANGYNKDWYGFDYGSLIGSFDGVHWFSIGNQRNIQAKSNKLYLAINAYFGDVTANNTFKIVVSETSAVANSGSTVTHDTDSDGAECQRAHYCQSDSDCLTQLGYEYTCQNVSNLNTPWPLFDSNGNEISGSNTLNLLGLIGGSNGQVKRCVYRGRGAICEKDLSNINSANSYTLSDSVPLHSCSSNTYCAELNESKFNTKISRYGDSPVSQNNKSYITDKTDTVGLAARVLGRPLNFYGTEPPPSGVKSQLNSINVNSICIPGKAPSYSASTFDLNKIVAPTTEADKILGIGRTYPSSTPYDPNYLSACPATNEDGNFTVFEDINLNDPVASSAHTPFAITQNMSTNSLNLSIFNNLNLFNDTSTLVTAKGYHKNTCLRAPGAKCFTDLDCSPNRFISNKVKTITNFQDMISVAEQNFWKEELVCANSQSRYIGNSTFPNPVYETYENRCCRETGNSFTYYSQKHENETEIALADSAGNPLVPGINISLDDPKRYSRTHTTYDKQKEEPERYPAMVSAAPRPTVPKNYTINNIRQYNTLHLNNARMCCTGHWVREFASGVNGNNGGHKFSGSKQQRIDVSNLKFLSWFDNNDPQVVSGDSSNTIPFACTETNIDSADCEIKNIVEGSEEELKYLNWFGKLELLGIPQVLIETNNSHGSNDKYNIFRETNEFQEDISSIKEVIPGTIKPNDGVNGVTDAIYSETGAKYYSAASTGTIANNYADGNFEIGSTKLKKVFSENKFNCCIPTGVEVDSTTTNEQCCSGQVTNQGGPVRCCLDDFTDLSVYTNRYVSSEGAYFNGQEISDNDIDPLTGYIKKEIILQMAPTMCCSGQAAYGVAISKLYIPTPNGGVVPDKYSRRWVYNSGSDDATDTGGVYTKFQAGAKWNNHVYCVPSGFDGSSGGTGGGAVSE